MRLARGLSEYGHEKVITFAFVQLVQILPQISGNGKYVNEFIFVGMIFDPTPALPVNGEGDTGSRIHLLQTWRGDWGETIYLSIFNSRKIELFFY